MTLRELDNAHLTGSSGAPAGNIMKHNRPVAKGTSGDGPAVPPHRRTNLLAKSGFGWVSACEMVQIGLSNEACHRLCQLRINFIGNGHHVKQKQAEVHGLKIILQRLKDANLQHP